MTIQEAIREAESIVKGGRMVPNGFRLPGFDRHQEFMETLLAAARKGAGEDLQPERAKLIEKSKQLTLESVGAAIRSVEDCLRDAEIDDGVVHACGEVFVQVLEYPVHTALAALRKVQADLLTMGEDAMEGSPRVHVVQMQVNGPEDADKILKQVESDLQKIFGEAAQGKA